MLEEKACSAYIIIIAAVLSNYLIFTKIQPDASMQPKLVMDVNCDKEELYQIYYSISEYKDGAWGEGDSVYANYSDKGKTRTIEFTFPQDINIFVLIWEQQQLHIQLKMQKLLVKMTVLI